MDVLIAHTPSIHGTVTVPGDKAICHRALLGCALATGTTRIAPWSTAADCRHTLTLLQRLGVHAVASPEQVTIEGAGSAGLRSPEAMLECGESGTTMRLASGLLAGQPITATLTGSPSLLARPMRRIVEPLTAMGASIQGVERPSARAGAPPELYPPLRIAGRRPLAGLHYTMPVASAQVKSAILLAGLSSREPVIVTEPSPTRDHTERMLRALGVSVLQREESIVLQPPRAPLAAPGRLAVPGDASSAAFFAVAAAALPGSSIVIEHVSLNPTRTRFLDVLARMGARIRRVVEQEAWEPQGRLEIQSAPLQPITIDPDDAPRLIDELPVLMVAACAARGVSRFEGLAELRVKETDRVRSMFEGLRALGADIRLVGETGMEITGGGLRGAAVECANDHRTAMSLAIAGLMAEGQTQLRGAECVSKSFGEFFQCLEQLAGPGSVRVASTSSSRR